MLRLRLSIDPAEAGAAMGLADDNQQAEFFNAFAKELHREARTMYSAQTQIEYVRNKLTEEAKEIFAQFGAE